jgi:ribosomal protein S18 acetylase RimI-like enzyme
MNITIKQLGPNIIDDYLYFFDNIAFVDNKEWDGCYCVFYHHDKNIKDWMARTKNDNRNMAINLINQGKLKGFLAFDNEKPIAWCNVNEKNLFFFDKNLNKVYCDIDNKIISIVCFLVSHKYRRRGISTLLLKEIINHYQKSSKAFLEAYPFTNVIKDSENYHGPLELYTKNGFYIDKEYDKYFVMKYKLSKEGD